MSEEDKEMIAKDEPMLSDQIRAWRKSAGLTIEAVAEELNAPPRIISAFEDANYAVFSARVYAVGYLKHIVSHFAIADGDRLVAALHREWDRNEGETNRFVHPLPKSRSIKWYITTRRLFGIGGGLALVFFFWFLAAQLMGFTSAPALRINEPMGNSVIDKPSVRIQGHTDKESQLTVNGREITMNELGEFDQEIELIAGVNTLHFLVQNRFGKVSQETRYVVVR